VCNLREPKDTEREREREREREKKRKRWLGFLSSSFVKASIFTKRLGRKEKE
jgi:hypothetical protein